MLGSLLFKLIAINGYPLVSNNNQEAALAEVKEAALAAVLLILNMHQLN